MESLIIPYRRSPSALAVSALALVGAIIFMADAARTNQRGLILNGIIHFDKNGATAFLGLMTFALVVFLALVVRIAWVDFATKPTVKLTATTIAAPASALSGDASTVAFSNICVAGVGQVRRRRYLYIEHSEGKLRIFERFLPQGDAFDTLCAGVERGLSGQAPGTSNVGTT